VLQFDWENSVGYWICMTSAAMRRALNAELAAQQITLRQWEVLACITLKGDLAQGDVAEQLGIEAPTLVGILDRMERDGWLERYGCPDDRRRKRIRATEKAEAVWNRMAECAHRVRARAIQDFSPEELGLLKQMCERLRENLAQDDGSPCPLVAVQADAANVLNEPAASDTVHIG
jgi:MarR family transcriptional regulator, transcriptional regulator for hemolysin